MPKNTKNSPKWPLPPICGHFFCQFGSPCPMTTPPSPGQKCTSVVIGQGGEANLAQKLILFRKCRHHHHQLNNYGFVIPLPLPTTPGMGPFLGVALIEHFWWMVDQGPWKSYGRRTLIIPTAGQLHLGRKTWGRNDWDIWRWRWHQIFSCPSWFPSWFPRSGLKPNWKIVGVAVS